MFCYRCIYHANNVNNIGMIHQILVPVSYGEDLPSMSTMCVLHCPSMPKEWSLTQLLPLQLALLPVALWQVVISGLEVEATEK